MGRGLSALLRGFAAACRGGIAPMAAAAVPAIAVLAVGASELATISADKSRLQDVADAAALTAAQELAFATTNTVNVEERAKAYATTELAALIARGSTVTPTASVILNAKGIPHGVSVGITANRESFFGNMLPPGGFTTAVNSTALRMGAAPLCVLTYSTGIAKTLNLIDSAFLEAAACLVHSNKEVTAEASSQIKASAVQAVGIASGNIWPGPFSGAESIADPFATKVIPNWQSPALPCVSTNYNSNSDLAKTLPAGRHCGETKVHLTDVVTMAPGLHYFDNDLRLYDTAKLNGSDVVLFFHQDADIELGQTAQLNLSGGEPNADVARNTWAGFLIVTARNHTNDFILKGQNVGKLLGTVYIPSAKLVVEGTESVGEGSAWTVVVARNVLLKGSATLDINSDYVITGSMKVPVPGGVGNKSEGSMTRNARLTN